eukprot:TRINITY_DN67158_c0_g1_i1.p1 TRINITY_DN67158_c0_g1~~TRINITY_DN67158_c0_g1_i1.p1  ORF type:complete len:561 (+),score=77.61 TRINITY_DN67158_c0_g1_i1:68-1750(+)
MPEFKHHFYNDLVTSNRLKTIPFVTVFRQVERAQIHARELANRCEILEKEQRTLVATRDRLAKELQQLKDSGSGSGVSLARAAEMDSKVQQLQNELQSAYKNKTENQQHLLELHREVTDLRQRTSDLESQLQSEKEKRTKAEQEGRVLCDAAAEAERRLAVVRGELEARLDEMRNSTQRRVELEQENAGLITRIMDAKQREGETMNQMTLLLESKDQKIKELEARVALYSSGGASGGANMAELQRLRRREVEIIDARPPAAMQRKFEAHGGEVNCAQFNVAGDQFVTSGNDKLVKVWDARNLELKATLHGATQSVMRVAWSPAGDYIVGAANDNGCYVWSTQSNRVAHSLTGHGDKVWGCGFLAGGRTVVTACHDRTVRCFDLGANGRCMRTTPCHSLCNDLAVFPGTDLFCTAHFDGTIRFWDARQGLIDQVEDAHEGQVTGVAVSPDQLTTLTFGKDNALRVYDVRTYKQLAFYKHEELVSSLNFARPCFSPDGNHVAVGSGGKQGGIPARLMVWNQRGKLVSNLYPGHKASISCCAWANDGQYVVTCGADKTVILWC